MAKEKERVYLSKVIDPSKFKRGQANIIIAPCHSGKTTAAITKIAPLAIHPEKVLILIDTRAGKDALAKKAEITRYTRQWLKEIAHNWWGSLLSGDGIRVMTYHQFGHEVERFPDFTKDIDIIICDEMHNLIKYRNIEYGKNKKDHLFGTEDEIKACKTALETLCSLANDENASALVVIMSATINTVSVALDKNNVNAEYFDLTAEVDCDRTTNRIYYSDLKSVIASIPLGSKAVIYLPTISLINDYAAIAEDYWHNVGCLWSISNIGHPMTEEQLELRKYIIDNQQIPENIDILFINAAYETSININNPDINTMVIHSSNSDTQVQVRGRIRHDIDTLYIYDSQHEHVTAYFPPEYYNKFLTVPEVKEIATNMDLKDSKGRFRHWPSIAKALEKDGVSAKKVKQHGVRGWIISPAS